MIDLNNSQLNRSLKLILFFAIFCTQNSSIANAADEELNLSFGIGGGLQYAGIVGARVNLTRSRHNLYASAGAVGIGIGYDYAITEQLTFGVNASAVPFSEAYSANISYHFNAAFEQGWHAGVDIITTPGGENETSPVNLFFSLGYRFK